MKYKLTLLLSKFLTFNDINDYEEFILLKRLKRGKFINWVHGKKGGKYWLACSPEWVGENDKLRENLNTKYEICYWINYGDDNTYGRFSVEQVIFWLENDNIKLHTLGGTKER